MPEIQGWHRRHAIHIVSELPDEPGDALKVLRLAIEVVERFLDVPQETARTPLSLISAARSLSRNETGNPPSSAS